MIAGRWILDHREKAGFWLVAPITYWNATELEIEKKTGGCGPGSIGDWFVPDTMYGQSVFFACQIHDWMYGEGESEEDKRIADMVFLWNMVSIIIDEKEVFDPLRLYRAMTYFEAVYFGGGSSFEKGITPRKEV